MLVAISVAEDTVQVNSNESSAELLSYTTGCGVAVECTQAKCIEGEFKSIKLNGIKYLIVTVDQLIVSHP